MTAHEIRQIRKEYLDKQARASSRQRGLHRKLRRRARRRPRHAS